MSAEHGSKGWHTQAMQESNAEYMLTAAEAAELRRLCNSLGERVLCKKERIPRATLARLIGRLPTRAGTLMVARALLARTRDGGTA